MSELSFLEKALENANVQAFLEMIRHCEGTMYPDGYYFYFGSREDNDKRLPDLHDHPGVSYAQHYVNKAGKSITTTAAGAYQFIHSTWRGLQAKLSLPDFEEHSQDLAALELLSEQNCVSRLMEGDFNYALSKANTIWASLPGAGVDQPERSLAEVTSLYTTAGGTIA